MKDVAVIGGGAAGLFFAVSLKRFAPDLSVVVFEAKERVGKKLAVTGNGRCNISNATADASHYHGDKDLAAAVLENFNFSEQQRFFENIGVYFKLEGDKAYPQSLQAASVVDALRFAVAESGVVIRCECPVTAVRRIDGGFTCITANGDEDYRVVVVACGGVAGGKLGSMCGYDILKSLGHKIEPLFPSLVQLKTDTGLVRQLKGIKVDATVTVKSSSGERTEFGEVLFCDYGISGPPVLQVSRMAQGENAIVELDLMPDFSRDELCSVLSRSVSEHPNRDAAELFTCLLNKRLGQVITKSCGVPLDRKFANISAVEISKIADMVKRFRLKVTGTTGFENAQVTAGGAQTAQFFPNFMSKKAKGLFAIGEVLNVDGDCGGYNLAFCWGSAHIAADAVAKYLSE